MRLFLLVLLLCLGLHADHDEHRERHLPMDISHLDLTRAQYDAMERLIRNHHEAHRRYSRDKRRTQEEIGRLFGAERFDKERYLALTAALRDEAAAIQAEFYASIHTLLTPRQRQAFLHYMEEWEIE